MAVELFDLIPLLDHAFDGRELQIDELLSLALEGGQLLFVLLDEDSRDSSGMFWNSISLLAILMFENASH